MWDIFALKTILHNSAQQWEQAWELCSMRRTQSPVLNTMEDLHISVSNLQNECQGHGFWSLTTICSGEEQTATKSGGFLTGERQLDRHEHFPSFLDKMVCLYLAGRFHRVEALLFLFVWLAGFCFVCMCVYACVCVLIFERFEVIEIRSDSSSFAFLDVQQ